MATYKPTISVQLLLPLHDIAPEEWRCIAEWEGFYEVSDLGRVRSCDRQVLIPATRRRGPVWKTVKGQMRQLTHGGKNSPYKRVHLWDQERQICRSVHHLVLETFVGPRPVGAVANHIDGNKRNNWVRNLEWCSPSQNNLHAIDTGLVRLRGEDHFGHKYTNEDVQMMRKLAAQGMSCVAIARELNFPRRTVHNIVVRNAWKHVP
jgi:hypothetical protein